MCLYAGAAAWSPRTIKRPEAIEAEKKDRKEEGEDYSTINLMFEVLKAYPEAHDAVWGAIEREAEKEAQRKRKT